PSAFFSLSLHDALPISNSSSTIPSRCSSVAATVSSFFSFFLVVEHVLKARVVITIQLMRLILGILIKVKLLVFSFVMLRILSNTAIIWSLIHNFLIVILGERDHPHL